MKLKDFKKLNENWDKWRSDEPVQEEKKNCGCGQDPCITYGVQNEGRMKEMEMQLADEIVDLLINRGAVKGGINDYGEAAEYLKAGIIPMMESLADAPAGSISPMKENSEYEAVDAMEAYVQKLMKDEGMTTEEAVSHLMDKLEQFKAQQSMEEAVSPEQQEANEKAYSLCYEMGRKGVDVHTARRKVAAADFQACRAGHQDGSNEFMQSLAERVRKTVANKLQEKAKSKNQQQFMGMVKKCQETGDCASAEVKKAADSMKKGDVDDFARTKHKGLPDTVEDKK